MSYRKWKTYDFPSEFMKCSGRKGPEVLKTKSMTAQDYKNLHRDWNNYVNSIAKKFNKELTEFTSPCLLRFAGHDFMDFRKGAKNQGGSDACLAF